jgi:hypothetical protein
VLVEALCADPDRREQLTDLLREDSRSMTSAEGQPSFGCARCRRNLLDIAIHTRLPATLTADLRFNLAECVRTMLGGNRHELPAVRVAAIYLVQTAWRVAGSTNDRSTRENIVDERSGLSAVKQASARFNFQSNSHDPLSFIDGARDQTSPGSSSFTCTMRSGACVSSSSANIK